MAFKNNFFGLLIILAGIMSFKIFYEYYKDKERFSRLHGKYETYTVLLVIALIGILAIITAIYLILME